MPKCCRDNMQIEQQFDFMHLERCSECGRAHFVQYDLESMEALGMLDASGRRIWKEQPKHDPLKPHYTGCGDCLKEAY